MARMKRQPLEITIVPHALNALREAGASDDDLCMIKGMAANFPRHEGQILDGRSNFMNCAGYWLTAIVNYKAGRGFVLLEGKVNHGAEEK